MPVEQVVLCGPGSAIPGLAERMEDGDRAAVRARRARRRSPGSTTASAARLTLPYGLALES